MQRLEKNWLQTKNIDSYQNNNMIDITQFKDKLLKSNIEARDFFLLKNSLIATDTFQFSLYLLQELMTVIRQVLKDN